MCHTARLVSQLALGSPTEARAANASEASCSTAKMADEEGVCPKPEIEESCKPHCIKELLAYQACAKRIAGKKDAHCTGQYFDYWKCIDHCAAPRLFAVLK